MTLNFDSCSTIFWHMLCNIKQPQNIALPLLWVDDLTCDKNIYVSQQQHYYGLAVISASL